MPCVCACVAVRACAGAAAAASCCLRCAVMWAATVVCGAADIPNSKCLKQCCQRKHAGCGGKLSTQPAQQNHNSAHMAASAAAVQGRALTASASHSFGSNNQSASISINQQAGCGSLTNPLHCPIVHSPASAPLTCWGCHSLDSCCCLLFEGQTYPLPPLVFPHAHTLLSYPLLLSCFAPCSSRDVPQLSKFKPLTAASLWCVACSGVLHAVTCCCACPRVVCCNRVVSCLVLSSRAACCCPALSLVSCCAAAACSTPQTSRTSKW